MLIGILQVQVMQLQKVNSCRDGVPVMVVHLPRILLTVQVDVQLHLDLFFAKSNMSEMSCMMTEIAEVQQMR